MKTKLLMLGIALLGVSSLQAQLNVGSSSAADASAILQATSTTKGFLPPKMSTTQISSIVNPAKGLIVYDSTINQLKINVGTTTAAVWAVGAANAYWGQTGNTGSNSGTNYLGTTDSAALSFRTKAVERVRIDSSGNVGFGTIPYAPLQFPNTIANRKIVLWDNINSVGNDSAFYGFGINNSVLRYQVPAGNNHSFFANKTQIATLNSNGAFSLTGTASGYATNDQTRPSRSSGLFSNGGLTRIWQSQYGDGIVLDSTGKVGIGTTTPATKFQVVAGDNLTTTILDVLPNNQSVGVGLWYGGVRTTGSAVNNPLLLDAKGTGSILLNTSGGTGNVGIGTTSPNAQLQFANTINNRKIVLWEDVNNDNQVYGFGVNNSILRYQVGSTGESHIFYAGTSATTSNELMRIQGNGGVAVNMGGQGSSETFQVNGGIRAGLTSSGGVILSPGSATQAGFIRFMKGNNTSLGYIGYDNTNLTYSAENGAVHQFLGNIAYNGTLTSNSDRRLKTNIVPVNSALANVMKLTAYTYSKKASISATDYNVKEMGFMAQDIQKIFPDLVAVGNDKDKTLSVNYTAIIPLLTKAIQEQQAQIAARDKKIANLETRLAAIEKALAK